MGEAKRRGTLEQRIEQSKKRHGEEEIARAKVRLEKHEARQELIKRVGKSRSVAVLRGARGAIHLENLGK